MNKLTWILLTLCVVDFGLRVLFSWLGIRCPLCDKQKNECNKKQENPK